MDSTPRSAVGSDMVPSSPGRGVAGLWRRLPVLLGSGAVIAWRQLTGPARFGEAEVTALAWVVPIALVLLVWALLPRADSDQLADALSVLLDRQRGAFSDEGGALPSDLVDRDGLVGGSRRGFDLEAILRQAVDLACGVGGTLCLMGAVVFGAEGLVLLAAERAPWSSVLAWGVALAAIATLLLRFRIRFRDALTKLVAERASSPRR